MSNSYFRFKQFTIFQQNCAMKVGTDGVLLGAWASVNQASHVLDVGTGTGLIALMIAQRSSAVIEAIDIDEGACRQAEENVLKSPFAGRIVIHQANFHSFQSVTTNKYDLIVSNPPYFKESLKCPDIRRNYARHSDSLDVADLIRGSKPLLSPSGRIAMVLPFDQAASLSRIAEEAELYQVRRTNIYPTPDAPPKRILVELARSAEFHFTEEQLIIESSRNQYTPEYAELTQAFYLKM